MEVPIFQYVTRTFLPSCCAKWSPGLETEGAEIDDIVCLVMMDLSLDQIICSLQNRNTFPVLIENARQARQPQPLCGPGCAQRTNRITTDPLSTSRATSIIPPFLDLQTASAPKHPSIPISFNPSIATPPRTASPTGSFVTVDQKRKMYSLYNAIARLEPQNATEIAGLVLNLNKKGPPLCPHNATYPNSSIGSAKNPFGVQSTCKQAGRPQVQTRGHLLRAQSGSLETPNLPYSRPSVAASPCCPLLRTPIPWPHRRPLLPPRPLRQPSFSSQCSPNSPRRKFSRSRVVATAGLPLS